MEETLQSLRTQALAELDTANDEQSVEAIRVKYLGRAGSISLMSEGMKNLGKEEKPRIGKLLNEVRTQVTAAIDGRKGALQEARDAAAFAGIDTTLPGIPAWRGGLHPMTLLMDRAVRGDAQGGAAERAQFGGHLRPLVPL